MKKWFTAIVLSLLLTAQLPITALAKESSSVSAVSAYGLQEKLYTFVQMGDDYDGTSMKGRITNRSAGEESSPVLISDSNSTVRYLFMIDLSGSMKNYINDVNNFVRSLMNHEKKEAVFTIATFGERFQTEAENLTDQKAVLETLNHLEYNEQITNPYDGIVNALTYLNSCPRLGGELVNLILITDGKPDLGYQDKTDEAKTEKTEADAAAEKIANTPEVVVHTFGLNQWSKTAFSTFSSGTGLNVDTQPQTKADAEECGKQIAEYVDGLYRTDFNLSGISAGDRFDIRLNFTGQTLDGQYAVPEVELHSVPVLHNASSGNSPLPPSDSDIENLPKSDSTSEATASTSSDPEEETTSKSSEDIKIEKKPASQIKTSSLPAILLTAAVILILLIFLFRKKRPSSSSRDKNSGRKHHKITAEDSDVFIRIQVIAGQYIGKSLELHLHNELFVGSSSDCDIIWQEEDVASKNSRIFIKDQIVYIEDLNSPHGTVLGGMRLFSANRLRSGDEISIGTVHFRLWF